MNRSEQEIMENWNEKNTDNPLVSISCITYNHEKYIEDALEGFLMQETDFPFEILIHDDASTDKTAEIIRKYEKKYPKIIKPIYQVENQYSKGVKKIDYTFNHSRAKGKYYAICEGDDYWIDSKKLQKQVDYMEDNPECGLCFHAAEIFKVGVGKVGHIVPYKKSGISTTEDIIYGGGGFMATNSILYKKSIMENPADFYFMSPVGDYPLQVLTSLNTYAYYINEVMSVYRRNVVGSWSLRTKKISIEEKNRMNESICTLLDNINKYSNYKYCKIIEKTKIKHQFYNLIDQGKFPEAKTGKFKEFYLTSSIIHKVYWHIRQYSPETASKLLDLRELVINRIKV
ncbi:glycosyltransferase [Methanococcus maripaludis]|uniref:Glycosyltransferase involved in cell wall biosynthesis n=1 Tax=Methanococcus maripaludis TaxID=39152 RepID=A0A7J9PB83_METMI|nr:glycosyltransferase [Methanococcus maripaludis]MBA2860462.1 glycosyltransferase involved in cell wall biosynthesis [Methanococcus maripaludis]